MSAISNFPTATRTTVWILNGSSLLFSFYTWRAPVCLLCSSFQYMVTWRCFCVLATPCLERSSRHKEEVRVYLFYSPLSQAALLFMVPIWLLYMFTNTPVRIIMSLHTYLSLKCKNIQLIGWNWCLHKCSQVWSDDSFNYIQHFVLVVHPFPFMSIVISTTLLWWWSQCLWDLICCVFTA